MLACVSWSNMFFLFSRGDPFGTYQPVRQGPLKHGPFGCLNLLLNLTRNREPTDNNQHQLVVFEPRLGTKSNFS